MVNLFHLMNMKKKHADNIIDYVTINSSISKIKHEILHINSDRVEYRKMDINNINRKRYTKSLSQMKHVSVKNVGNQIRF